MKLYHGTNADIGAIDLNQGLRYKDFGKGFYATPDRKTAIRMAQKRQVSGSAILFWDGKGAPFPSQINR